MRKSLLPLVMTPFFTTVSCFFVYLFNEIPKFIYCIACLLEHLNNRDLSFCEKWGYVLSWYFGCI